MSSNIRRGQLRPDDKHAVSRNYSFLLKELDSVYIARYLFAHNVIYKNEEEEIVNEGNREKANEKLLNRILFSGPGYAYNIFLESLKENQEHVLKTLTDSRDNILKAQQINSRNSEETIAREIRDDNDIESDGPGTEACSSKTVKSEATIEQPDAVSTFHEELALQNLLKEMDELRNENKKLNDQLITSNQESEEKSNSLLAELESLKDKNSTFNTELEALKTENARQNSEIEELRDTNNVLTATIKDLENGQIKTNVEIMDLKTDSYNLKVLNDTYRARDSPSFESQVKSQKNEILLLHAERFQMVNDLDACLQKIIQNYHLKPADVNIQELFHFASMWGFLQTVTSLIGKGVDVDKQIQVKQKKVVIKSLGTELKTDVIDKLEKKQSALMAAANRGSFKTLDVLLGNGAKVNDKDCHGDTALFYACRGRCLEDTLEYVTRGKCEQPFIANDQALCIDNLIKRSADIDSLGHHGMTALMCCAKNGDFRLLETLLMHFPNKEVKCSEGKTALMYACSKNCERNTRCVKILLRKSCDENVKDFKGETALMHCIEADNFDAFLCLTEGGADVNARNEQGLTCLMHAASKNQTCYMEELLKRKPDVNRQDTTMTTALMIAVMSPAPSSGITLLLQNGADPNIQNCKGETALMLAASHVLVDKVRALLSTDVTIDVNLRANNGTSALKMARRSILGSSSDKEKIVSLLIGANAKE